METKSRQLLPRRHEEFRTKAYWDDFFERRGGRAFEWYGDYHKLSKLCQKTMDRKDSILVIGCGNSDFSSDLYDSGFRSVTNVDFSEKVVQSMAIKNALRSEMRWLVMDMTDMDFPVASFDVVFDKGALDALMAVDSAEVREKADSMFSCIARAVRPGGRYVCVTLAEPFIVQHLLQHFLALGWELSIDVVSECGGREVPFVPFFATMTKPMHVNLDGQPNEVYPLKLFFNSFGERLRRPTSATPNDSLDCIRRVQSFQQRRHDLGGISVGRFEHIDLWAESGGDPQTSAIPKYSLTILDHQLHAARSCAVFFVPFGREAAYQFNAQDCLSDIAAQAATKRLLVVRCNRPHSFPDMKAIQAELSPICASLAPLPASGDPLNEPIPFMAVEATSEWVTVASGEGKITGQYVVEEMESKEDGAHPGTVYRRLIFLRNQQFVQTEVRLVPVSKKNSRKKKKAKSAGLATADPSTVNGEAVVGGEGVPSNDILTTETGSSKTLQFDHGYLDAHHCSILVSLSLLHQFRSREQISGLLIGLGGGALPMAIRRYFPYISLVVCELDPDMLCIARQYFGYVSHPSVEDLVGDGLNYIQNSQAACGSAGAVCEPLSPPPAPVASVGQEGGKKHFIVLDADSADASLGLTAPPAEFTTIAALSSMYELLVPDGILVINTVARDKVAMKVYIDSIRYVFSRAGGGVYTIKPSADTVNLTIVAVKSAACISYVTAALLKVEGGTKNKKNKIKTSTDSSGPNDLKLVLQIMLQRILNEANLSSDPLELMGLIESIKEVET